MLGKGDSAVPVTRQPCQTAGHFLADGRMHQLTQTCESWGDLCWEQHRVTAPGLIWGGVAEVNRERLGHCSSDELFWCRAAQMFPLPVYGSF